MKAREWTDEEREARSGTSKRLGLARHVVGTRWKPGRGAWTADEVALLGTELDAAVAAKLGRSVDAVRSKRRKLRAVG